jgi:hypothetical protein
MNRELKTIAGALLLAAWLGSGCGETQSPATSLQTHPSG